MKIKNLILVSLFALPAVSAAKEINVSVNGMVCSFCAQGITKKFEELPQVSKVKVSLEDKNVQVQTKEDQDIPDEKIKELITSAGYNVEKIERAQ